MCVGKSQSSEEFYQMIMDQFDQLYTDSEHSGRVMALCLHPFFSNQPHRQNISSGLSNTSVAITACG